MAAMMALTVSVTAKAEGEEVLVKESFEGTVSSTVFSKFTTNVPDSYFEIPKGYGYLNLSWLESLGALE